MRERARRFFVKPFPQTTFVRTCRLCLTWKHGINLFVPAVPPSLLSTSPHSWHNLPQLHPVRANSLIFRPATAPSHQIMARSSDGAKSAPHSPQSNAEDDNDQFHDNDDKSRSGLRKKRIQQACRPCGIKRIKVSTSHRPPARLRTNTLCEFSLRCSATEPCPV